MNIYRRRIGRHAIFHVKSRASVYSVFTAAYCSQLSSQESKTKTAVLEGTTVHHSRSVTRDWSPCDGGKRTGRRLVCSGTPQVLRGGINNLVSASWCGVNGKATPPSREHAGSPVIVVIVAPGGRGGVTPAYRTPVAYSRSWCTSLSFSFSSLPLSRWVFIIFFLPYVNHRARAHRKRDEWTVHACHTALPVEYPCVRYRVYPLSLPRLYQGSRTALRSSRVHSSLSL